ncbi:aromatic alcohol reductase, partial [Klebsiella pneumoniae]|nr:aromatic alcohol reductase [Klebsiella pneumoniae]
MKKTDTNITSKNILVLGAGELGLPVLRSLALRARDEDDAKISVLLRASAIKSNEPDKRKLITEIRNLGIEIIEGDLINSSIDELAEIFTQYDTVIGCAG